MEIKKIIFPVIVDLRDSRGKWHCHVHVQDLKAPPFGDKNPSED